MFTVRVFFPFALGYFLSHLFRSINAIIAADLTSELGLDAAGLGFLTSAYFLAFASAQLPVGVALDRFGPRRTEACLLLVAATGGLLFAGSESFAGLMVGRGLIGLGVSACLMASFKAFVLWAPAGRLPFLNGAVMTAGAAGSLAATEPVEWALGFSEWRGLFVVLAVVTVAVAAVLVATVPERKTDRSSETLSHTMAGIGEVFRSRVFWSIAPLSVAHQGTYLAIQGLWAGPWLSDVAGLDRPAVAEHLLVLAMGMGIGFAGIGWIAGRLALRGVSLLTSWCVAHVAFLLAQTGIVLHWTAAARELWFAFGLFGASGSLGYAILTGRFDPSLAGRVNASLNVLVFTGAFAIQAGIGAIVKKLTAPGALGFAPEGYRVGFGVALALELLCLGWLVASRGFRRGNAPPS